MKSILKIIGITISILTLASCSYDDMAGKLIPQDDAKFAEDYIAKLRTKDFEYIKSLMSEEILPQVNDEILLKMSDYFRDGELLSTEIVGSQVHIFNDKWQGNFTFEYEFTSGWNIANTVLRKVDGKYEVVGLNVYQTKASQRQINAFTLSSKTPLHYFILFMAITVPFFTLVTTYYCAKTPIPKKKWLWIIFILFGVSALQINWTTGQYGLQLLSIHLFGASILASSPHAPWILSASIPLGAIIFWFKRKRFIELYQESTKD